MSRLFCSTQNYLQLCKSVPHYVMQHHTEISELVVGLIIVFVMCHHPFWSWSRLGLSLLWWLCALDLAELCRNACSLGPIRAWIKAPSDPAEKGKFFPYPKSFL